MNANLRPLTEEEKVDPVVIARKCFQAIAKFHAARFMDKAALDIPWVQGREWSKGEGAAAWEKDMGNIASSWKATRAKTDDDGVNWSPLVLSLLDASIEKCSFDDYVKDLQVHPWALIHGDFHPANIMWDTQEKVVKLLDWQVVSIRDPTSDLGQFLISHMTPEMRRSCEESLVKDYYTALIENGVDSNAYSWESCWKRYSITGFRRWVFLLAYIATLGMPSLTQYFNDQMLAFAQDHQLTPEIMEQPLL